MTAYEGVHWQLRQGLCSGLARLAPMEGRASRATVPLEELSQLLDAYRLLHAAEEDVLEELGGRPDSSLANADLAWAAGVLQRKIAAARETLTEDRLADLRRYLALFLGELLVQLHAKEAEVQQPLLRQLRPASLQRLDAALAAISTFLRPPGRRAA